MERWISATSRPTETSIDTDRPDDPPPGPPGPAPALDPVTAAVLDAVPDAVLLVDGDGVVRHGNAPSEAVLGWPLVDLVGRHVEDLVPPRYRGHHVDLRTGFRPRPMGLLQLAAVRADGSEFAAEISLAPIDHACPEAGTAGRWVCATIRDVTARRTAENRFRDLVEAAPDPLLIADQDGCVLHANGRFETVLGWTEEALVGRPVTDALVPPRLRERYAAADAEIIAALRESKAAGVQRTIAAGPRLAWHRTGTEVPVEVTIAALDSPDGPLFGITARDLRADLRAAAENDLFRENLVAGVSHELRTPLTSIVGYLELVLDLPSSDVGPAARDLLQLVERNAHRQLAMVEDLLAAGTAAYVAARPQPLET